MSFLVEPQNQSDGFSLVWASKPMAMICEWFSLKTARTVFAGLASKPVATISAGLASKPATTVSSGLASKPAMTVFFSLASKLVATVFSTLASKQVAMVSPGLASNWRSVSWLSLKTKVVEGFLVWASKPAALVW
jgi:hypothetical protein